MYKSSIISQFIYRSSFVIVILKEKTKTISLRALRISSHQTLLTFTSSPRINMQFKKKFKSFFLNFKIFLKNPFEDKRGL